MNPAPDAAAHPSPPSGPHSRAEIVVEAGRNRGFAVTVNQSITAGRDPDCELQVFDTLVSRRHFRIIKDEVGFVLEDLSSSNGTSVNFTRVTRVRLYHRDLISCGEARLRFLCPSCASPGKTSVTFAAKTTSRPTDKIPAPMQTIVFEFDAKQGLPPPPKGPGAPPGELIAAFNLVQETARQSDSAGVFDTLFRSLDEVVACERMVLSRVNPQSFDVIPVLHRRSLADAPGGSLEIDRERILRCCRSGKAYAESTPTGAWRVTIPMEGREEIHGALSFESTAEQDARPRLPLAAAVCRQAGLVLEQCALLTTVRQQKLRLEEMNRKAQEATQVIELEQGKVRDREGQIVQLQKMEAVGRLAGGIAHDFNNMLTAILGYTDLLLGELDPQGPLHRHAQQIHKASRRAATLTQQLLAFSRKQVLQPRVLDLNHQITDMEGMLQPLIGEHIQLVKVLDAEIGKVRADPGQLQQVVLNLVVNARDAMPGGGTITIETTNAELTERDLPAAPQPVREETDSFPPVRPGLYVALSVSDTGRGIDEATRARLFEPFFTTKEKGKGTGLGLSTVYGIVTQSGGQIKVHSEVGKGSTFTIFLPRSENPVVTPSTPVPGRKPAQGSETLLLVEDDVTVRDLLAGVLRAQGYFVLVAVDGEDALTVSSRYPGRIALVLSDMVMPRLQGEALANRLGETRPDAKIILMSGYNDSRILRVDGLGRASAYLQKPFSNDKLLSTIREVLSGS